MVCANRARALPRPVFIGIINLNGVFYGGVVRKLISSMKMLCISGALLFSGIPANAARLDVGPRQGLVGVVVADLALCALA